MSHSPEPWSKYEGEPWGKGYHGYFKIVDADGHHVATVLTNTVDGKEVVGYDLNAHRIVACVNACHGISTEQLAKGVMSIAPFQNKAYLKYRSPFSKETK